MQELPDDPRELVTLLRNRGPMTLLFDGRHPGNEALPTDDNGDIIRIDCSASDERLTLTPGAQVHIRYLHGEQLKVAKLAYSALFFASGVMNPTTLGRKVLTDRVPACLDPQRMVNLRRMLNQMGLGPARPGSLEWNFLITNELLASDADRRSWCPDRLEAVQRCIDSGSGHAVLMVDASPPPGQALMPGQPTINEIAIGKSSNWQNVTVQANQLQWTEHRGDQQRSMSVPLRAIGAIQDPGVGQGWWWPESLPQEQRQQLQSNAELWSMLLPMAGIPLAPPVPLPAGNLQILTLAPPPMTDKREALETLARSGLCVVLVNALATRMQLPPSLPGRARVLIVPLGLMNLPPQLQFQADGFSAQMPDFEGKIVQVQIPWHAVFLIASPDGTRHAWWPQDYPEVIVTALHALRSVHKSDGGELPKELNVFDLDPAGDGLGLGVERAPDGGGNLVISQPMGGNVTPPPEAPPGSVARLVLQLSFRLPPPVLQ